MEKQQNETYDKLVIHLEKNVDIVETIKHTIKQIEGGYTIGEGPRWYLTRDQEIRMETICNECSKIIEDDEVEYCEACGDDGLCLDCLDHHNNRHEDENQNHI